MGRMHRNKGARGEREVIGMLQPIVDELCASCSVERIMLQRNLLQAHTGGHDLHGLDWLSLEVKRQERSNMGSWWRQTLKQCRPGQTPVLVHRANHQPWQVRMRTSVVVGDDADGTTLAIDATVDISIDDFLDYFYARLALELSVGGGGEPHMENER